MFDNRKVKCCELVVKISKTSQLTLVTDYIIQINVMYDAWCKRCKVYVVYWY